ncbi:MAG: hypothetical protein ACRDYA_18415 [Egibacteraceae bacterium]
MKKVEDVRSYRPPTATSRTRGLANAVLLVAVSYSAGSSRPFSRRPRWPAGAAT